MQRTSRSGRRDGGRRCTPSAEARHLQKEKRSPEGATTFSAVAPSPCQGTKRQGWTRKLNHRAKWLASTSLPFLRVRGKLFKLRKKQQTKSKPPAGSIFGFDSNLGVESRCHTVVFHRGCEGSQTESKTRRRATRPNAVSAPPRIQGGDVRVPPGRKRPPPIRFAHPETGSGGATRATQTCSARRKRQLRSLTR
jgi:hypothetical protein